MLKTILQQREESVFYGIIVDATRDIIHQEQNVLILLNPEKYSFEVCEKFIDLPGKETRHYSMKSSNTYYNVQGYDFSPWSAFSQHSRCQ